MDDRPIEVSAPDVEKAIERGLAQLGLTRNQASIEIVDQGSRGILGIGARDAVVRLRPLTAPEGVAGAEHQIAAARGPETHGAERERPSPEPEPESEDAKDDSDYAPTEDEVADIARQTLVELLDRMGIECEVTIRREDAPDSEPPPITLDVLGAEADVLIGRQGEVLSALQYISRLIVSREVEHWVNLVVDVKRYKQRRAKSLKQLAERIAERVARTRQPVALEPMPPNERRVIHVALHDHPTVTTQSVGKGEERKVTIIPRR